MTTLREAAEMALIAMEEAVEYAKYIRADHYMRPYAIENLRKALERPDHTEQNLEMVATCKECLPVEPVAFAYYWPPTNTLRRNPAYQLECGPTTAWKDEIPLYTAQPPREWQGLTHEERDEICKDFVGDDDRVGAYRSLALEVEVRLTERNK